MPVFGSYVTVPLSGPSLTVVPEGSTGEPVGVTMLSSSISTGVFWGVSTPSSTAGPGVKSLRTVTVTVAVASKPDGSVTVYSKVSSPENPALGV